MSNSLIKNHGTSETSLYFLYSLSICSSKSHSFELCIWLCMSIFAFNKTCTICLQANYHLMNWIQSCLFCYLLFVILSIKVSSTNFINAFLMLSFELVIKLLTHRETRRHYLQVATTYYLWWIPSYSFYFIKYPFLVNNFIQIACRGTKISA